MKTTIYYYTGTGNSLWIAQRLAAILGDADLVSIADWEGSSQVTDSAVVGIVFPVFIWGVPARVIRFVNALKDPGRHYVFAVATNGGQVSGTLLQLRDILGKRGAALSGGFGITMPSSYIPWGGPCPEEEQRMLFESARKKVSTIAKWVAKRERRPVEKGPLWQRVLFTPIYKMTFPRVPMMDKQFWVDGKCNGCGVCGTVCPSGNVVFDGGKPTWNHRCEQCFACLQWCPREAIQYGKKTPLYKRYHHPEVSLRDAIKKGSAHAGSD